jgi:HAD superfamily hydrolase (TIGR01549 family)
MTVAVLFDLDGVLVDSFDTWLSLVNATALHFGHPPVSAEQFRATFGGPSSSDAELFFPGISTARVEAYYEEHFAEHISAIKPLPGSQQIIETLDDRGILSGIITNSPSSIARLMLEAADILPHALVGSNDVDKPKPAPDMIYRACAVLGSEPWDALVVGDSIYDRQAAAAAAAPFAGIGGIAGNFTIAHLDEVLAIVEGTYTG